MGLTSKVSNTVGFVLCSGVATIAAWGYAGASKAECHFCAVDIFGRMEARSVNDCILAAGFRAGYLVLGSLATAAAITILAKAVLSKNPESSKLESKNISNSARVSENRGIVAK